MFDLLKYVPTRRNEWNFYGLSTIKRRRTFETTKKNFETLRGRDDLFSGVWCFSFTKHTVRPGDTGTYVGAEKIMHIYFWPHGLYLLVVLGVGSAERRVHAVGAMFRSSDSW